LGENLKDQQSNEDNLSPYQKWKQNLGDVRPWDLLIADSKVSDEVQKERFDICKGCPELIQLTSTCKKCGCFMAAKTKLKEAACPIGKWGKHE
jgi:hypothetical protein